MSSKRIRKKNNAQHTEDFSLIYAEIQAAEQWEQIKKQQPSTTENKA